MPEIDKSALLADVRKAYPGADKVPDNELLAALEKKYPQYAGKLTGGGDTFSVREKALAHLRSEASGPARQRYEGAQQEIQSGINVSAEKTASVAAAVPFAAIDVVAGPLKKVPGLGKAITATEALTSRVVYESVKQMLGSNEKGLEGKALAVSLGTDIAAAEALESKTLGKVAKAALGGPASVIKKYAARAMAEVADGGKFLKSMLFDKNQELMGILRNQGVKGFGDVAYLETGPLVKKALDTFDTLAKGVGRSGKELTKLTQEAKVLVGKFTKDLKFSGKGINLHQPIDGLIEMKRTLQDTAYNAPLQRNEREIFKRLAGEFDAKITAYVKGISDEALDLYKGSERLWSAANKHDHLTEMVRSHIPGVAEAGKIVGSLATLGAKGLKAVQDGVPDLMLRMAAEHPQAFGLMKKAVSLSQDGFVHEARKVLGRALVMSGAMEAARKITSAKDDELQ